VQTKYRNEQVANICEAHRRFVWDAAVMTSKVSATSDLTTKSVSADATVSAKVPQRGRPGRPPKNKWTSRSFWLRHMQQWHWISAAISLVGMLLFAITGITLNHASQIDASRRTTQLEAKLPAELLSHVKANPPAAKLPVPAPISDWINGSVRIDVSGRPAEWSASEVYVALPRPGGDAWLTIDRASGEIAYERTDRGWISYLNDLHKGRNTGLAWSLFLDVFALACIVFCVTGFVLLKLHAVGRPSTWPMVGLGIVVPIIVLLIFVH
jgi:hypothetical protein